MKILNITFLKQPLLDIANRTGKGMKYIKRLSPITYKFYLVSVNEYYGLNILSKDLVDSINRKVGTGKLLNCVLNELLRAQLIECNTEETNLDNYVLFNENASPTTVSK